MATSWNLDFDNIFGAGFLGVRRGWGERRGGISRAPAEDLLGRLWAYAFKFSSNLK